MWGLGNLVFTIIVSGIIWPQRNEILTPSTFVMTSSPFWVRPGRWNGLTALSLERWALSYYYANTQSAFLIITNTWSIFKVTAGHMHVHVLLLPGWGEMRSGTASCLKSTLVKSDTYLIKWVEQVHINAFGVYLAVCILGIGAVIGRRPATTYCSSWIKGVLFRMGC